MPRKKHRVIEVNSEKTGYTYFYEYNGVRYAPDSLNEMSYERDAQRTQTVYDKATGEILDSYSYDVVSAANSRTHLHYSGFDIAKDKTVPREIVPANGKPAIDLCRQYSDYIQVSAGSTHAKRGIVVCDIDLEMPSSKVDTIDYVQSVMEKHFKNMEILGVSKPTSYQIHLTNGHVQAFWVLENEIFIKRQVTDFRIYAQVERKYYELVEVRANIEYHRLLSFYAYLMGGDQNYTGWQIKNMFISDEIFKDSFKTFWLDGDKYTDVEPQNMVKYAFQDLHKEIYGIISSPDKTDAFYNIIGKPKPTKEEETDIICNKYKLSKTVQKKFNIVKKNKEINVLEGRNQFVRRKTFEFIRIYKNKLEMSRCRELVRAALNDALRKYGRLAGTKNNSPYTEREFERDFTGAYNYGVATYNPYRGYTDEQRRRAWKQAHDKKNVAQMAVLAILEEHPELIPSTRSNNKKIIELIPEYNPNVKIKATNTIANYKKELGIKNTQKKLSPKNYKKTDKAYHARILRKHELRNTYIRKDETKITEHKKREWIKRISAIEGTQKVYDIYIKRKRFTSDLTSVEYVIDEITNQTFPIIDKNKSEELIARCTIKMFQS